MIGTSKFDYFFIRLCIFGLHWLAPLCLLYSIFLVILYGYQAVYFRFPILLETVALAETLFYLLVYTPYRIRLQKEAVHPPAPTREERRELFRRCNENIPDAEAYIQKWFLGAPAREIKNENFKEFLLWAFFNRGGNPGDDDEELEEYVKATEILLGRPFEPGRGRAKCLRLTLDRVDMLHRSLTWYFCVGFVDFLTYLKLIYHGFHFHRTSLSQFFKLFPLRPVTLTTSHHSPAKHTTYWHRAHTSTTKLPIVFIHGIGIGLYPYTNFLNEINTARYTDSSDQNDQIGIIAIEIMPISFRITHSALGREEICAEINQIIKEQFGGDQKFVLVSHSYGTIITTHLLKSPIISHRIGPVVLVDPVSVLLHLPDVAYNFTRRQPREANEHQLYYFASMDMGVSHALSRHFFWNENVLWKQDLANRKVTISLGGRDLIVNTEAVGRYLSEGVAFGTSKDFSRVNGTHHSEALLIDIQEDYGESTSSGPGLDERVETRDLRRNSSEEEWKYRPWSGVGIDVMWHQELDHAQVFDKPSTRRRLIQAIRAYCEQG